MKAPVCAGRCGEDVDHVSDGMCSWGTIFQVAAVRGYALSFHPRLEQRHSMPQISSSLDFCDMVAGSIESLVSNYAA